MIRVPGFLHHTQSCSPIILIPHYLIIEIGDKGSLSPSTRNRLTRMHGNEIFFSSFRKNGVGRLYLARNSNAPTVIELGSKDHSEHVHDARRVRRVSQVSWLRRSAEGTQ